MNYLESLFGLATIASLVLSLYLYLKMKATENIENEKIKNIDYNISNMANYIAGVIRHHEIITVLTKRENTDLNEVRHLCYLIQIDLHSIYSMLKKEESKFASWKFGHISSYVVSPIKDLDEISKKDKNSAEATIDGSN